MKYGCERIGTKYFELGCRRCDRSGRGRERRPLGEGGLRRRSRRDRCMEGLARLSTSGLYIMVFICGTYGSLGQLLVL